MYYQGILNVEAANRKAELAREFSCCMLDVDRPLSLDDVAAIYNVSKERVRQIEIAALSKVVRSLRGNPDLRERVSMVIRRKGLEWTPHRNKRKGVKTHR